ncbi:S41 family peptidase [Pseudoalteromonas mariniglutinosa]|uniref:S41 family peptidase n=1 Tax=Pseudoalteromonas mariniglutinosa TaxID=206042 RepID=UPI00384DF410
MFIQKKLFRYVQLSALSLALTGCGGGSNTSGTNNNGTNTTISWTEGVFSAANNFAQQCQALNEKHWLRAWSHETYLWYDEIIDTDPALTNGVLAYFDSLKTVELTESGAQKDNFHFSLPTDEWQRQNQSGISYGYGFNIKIVAPSAPRQAVITYTEPNTPASTQNLTRGFELLEVNGIDFINTTSSTDVAMINAALFPEQINQTTEFVFKDINSNEIRTVTLTSQSITAQPVVNVRTDLAAGEVGYFQFNSHNAIAESQLYNAFNQLAASNISDLVIDVRYNGGGLLQMASQVAYMIAGPNNTQGKIFERTIFNDKNPNTNPITGQPLVPMSFTDRFIGFADNPTILPGTILPTLNLDRVFILTTSSTCSASEAIINGLRGVDIEIIQIGAGTCGKPYGFYPTDNCDTTYFTIQFTGQNHQGFGEYSDGFAPQNTIDNARQPVRLAGCAVADDFTQQLGDENEALLQTALSYRNTGRCPIATSLNSIQGFAPMIGADAAIVEDRRAHTLLKQNTLLHDSMR